MASKTSSKVASVALFLLGLVEVSGTVLFLVLPQESTREFMQNMGIHLPWELSFAAGLSAIFGLSRVVAGCAVWLMKKWGFVLGVVVSAITLIVVPLVYRTGIIGIMDMVLAMVALIFLLRSWFGGDVVGGDGG